MKIRNSNLGQRSASKAETQPLAVGFDAKVRHLHKDYKLALAMTLAGKTDAEIVAELKVEGVDEAQLKKNMAWLLRHLGLDDFASPVLRTRPVRRALRGYWVYDFE